MVIPALGVTQILAYGSSYYLPAVLAQPIVLDTGWPLAWVIGGLSLGLLVAGLISPRVGQAIERRGGRPVLILSALLLAAGLIALAMSPVLPVFLLAWVILGLGMGAGLYDAAFATLGRLYGQGARQAITMLTLFGGFASTICWPLTALLDSQLGWRGTCLVYAAIQLLVAIPIYRAALPKAVSRGHPSPEEKPAEPDPPVLQPARSVFALLAGVTTISAVIATSMSVHLFTILQAHGAPLATAVALAALIGPSQVAARAVEMTIARRHHPIWTKLTSGSAVVIGLAALWSGVPLLAVPLVLYGVGNGLESIARGTLPLSLFGAQGYAEIMGRIAMPSLIAQAVTPSLGAVLAEHAGADSLLGAMVGLAALNLLLAVVLKFRTQA